ncbi:MULTISPECIES: hypothetical protein [Halorussus]|uniref:hypothetical protein n=1 Tax=Halorussus TaxID=1070314 RepID=UPI0020A00AB6|nr:hypothetical protein [Halorussus vallis]USZ74573.1 hypothetical protein NGM07_14120 [Halorussus vallis]
MASKLRAFTAGGGGFLFALSAWALLEYGPTGGFVPFLGTAALGVAVAALPRAYVAGRFRFRQGLRFLRFWRESARQPDGDGAVPRSTFVSASPVPDDVLDRLAATIRDDDAYDGVRRESFPEGDGLTVTHAGFHNSFVRVTDASRLVVNGTSEKTRRLVEEIEETFSVSVEPADINPFGRSAPIRRAPKVALALAAVVLVVLGTGGVVGAAYQSDAYNPAERGMLVAIDARSDVDPGMSERRASLEKARFLVGMLEEEAVEIGWEYNTTGRVTAHGRDALAIAENARLLLAEAREGNAPGASRADVSQIEANLRSAERSVADALDRKAQKLPGSNPRIGRIRETLLAGDRAAANASVEFGPSTAVAQFY